MGILDRVKYFLLGDKTDDYVKEPLPPESVIFNVDNFNEWFCDPNNNAIYANMGIFLRTDKLSESQIEDYLNKKYGISNPAFLWSEPSSSMISNLYRDIRKDWIEKINSKNK